MNAILWLPSLFYLTKGFQFTGWAYRDAFFLPAESTLTSSCWQLPWWLKVPLLHWWGLFILLCLGCTCSEPIVLIPGSCSRTKHWVWPESLRVRVRRLLNLDPNDIFFPIFPRLVWQYWQPGSTLKVLLMTDWFFFKGRVWNKAKPYAEVLLGQET